MRKEISCHIVEAIAAVVAVLLLLLAEPAVEVITTMAALEHLALSDVLLAVLGSRL